MTKFLIFFTLVLMLDPCHIEPKALKISEVNEMCNSDHPTKYVKLQGFMIDKGSIICRDMPGGIRCELYLGERNINDTNNVRVYLKGTKYRDDLNMYGGLFFNAPKDWNGLAPVETDFDKITMFDTEGVRIDHFTESVEIAGTLKIEEKYKECVLQNVTRVRRIN